MRGDIGSNRRRNLPVSLRWIARDQIEDILSAARSLRFARNAHIFEQGAEAQFFFLLLRGHVQALKVTPKGEQVVVRYVSTGEIFGVAHAIGLSAYPATAIAAVDSVVLIWPASMWSDLPGNIRRLRPERCLPSVPAFRKRKPASSRCRPKKWNGGWHVRS